MQGKSILEFACLFGTNNIIKKAIRVEQNELLQNFLLLLKFLLMYHLHELFDHPYLELIQHYELMFYNQNAKHHGYDDPKFFTRVIHVITYIYE